MSMLITILTEDRYVNPTEKNDYINNVLLEDDLMRQAVEKAGYQANRKSWSDKDYNWSESDVLIFRTTWDYFERFEEFKVWLESVKNDCILINSYETILWNRDKIYLNDLQQKGIRIPNTTFIEMGTSDSLASFLDDINTDEFILKPNISGAAMDTFRLKKTELEDFEKDFTSLISKQAMMVQDFQKNIITRGEISLVYFGTTFSHAVLKKAVEGDYRVQDDFGGSVHHYEPNSEELAFAKKAIEAMPYKTLYARVDLMWDNNDQLCLSELELIEPELWLRNNHESIDIIAKELKSWF